MRPRHDEQSEVTWETNPEFSLIFHLHLFITPENIPRPSSFVSFLPCSPQKRQRESQGEAAAGLLSVLQGAHADYQCYVNSSHNPRQSVPGAAEH